MSVLLLLSISLPVFGQTERWVYRYNGPADSAEQNKGGLR
jgi:hypothetical protein